MTKKITEDFIKQLNPHARVLLEEYKIAFEKKMWASVTILSPTYIAPSISSALFLASWAVKLDSVAELLRSVALIVLPLAKLV